MVETDGRPHRRLVEFQPCVDKIPFLDLARNGKALPYGDDECLILSSDGNRPSLFFDMSNGKMVSPWVIPFYTGGSKNIGFFNQKILFVCDDIVKAYDLEQRRESKNYKNVVSKLAASSVGSTVLNASTSVTGPVLGGGIYTIGGRDKQTNAFRKDVQFFAGFHWEDRPPMQLGRCDAAAVSVYNKVIVTGGFFWDQQTFRYKECPYVEIFDGNDWYFGPSLNVARQKHSAVVIGDSMVVVLGGVTSENNEPIGEIEVWNMDARSGFVVLPDITLASDRSRRSPFDAIVHRGRDVYLIGGGTTAIGKISFDLDALTHFTALAAAPDPEVNPTTDYDKKPAAGMKNERNKSVANTSLASASYSGANSNINNMVSWLPNPPSLPPTPVATTLRDRNKAMSRYSECLRTVQERYRQTIEESAEKITEHYDRLRDQQIDIVRFHGTSWLSDMERRIQEAEDDMKLQEQLLSAQQETKAKAASIVAFLKQTDQDEFYDNIPSQLRCPLTLDIMTDPVVASDGNTYERSALEDWFRNSRLQQGQLSQQSNSNNKKHVPRSPLTGAELRNEDFFPVHTLRSMCQAFAKQMNGGANGGV
jgi:hypothetical protein